jgi:hypothetical protein
LRVHVIELINCMNQIACMSTAVEGNLRLVDLGLTILPLFAALVRTYSSVGQTIFVVL